MPSPEAIDASAPESLDESDEASRRLTPMATPVRLQRYLAAAGVAARRKAEELITAGRVTVNGEVVTVLGTKVDPDNDSVTVDGEAVVALDHFYVLFNKPRPASPRSPTTAVARR